MSTDFIAFPVTTYSNYLISFTDLSTGGPTSWLWDFGDGTTSTEQNPTKKYNHAGIYTVSLTADSSTETKVNYIKINLTGVRQKTNYIYVTGKLKTWDYAPPLTMPLLRIMVETGNGHVGSISKGGANASLPLQETAPIGTGFIRSSGPTVIFD